MIKIKLIKNTKEAKAGDIIEVTGNIAHGIIDRGEGKLDIIQDRKFATVAQTNNRILKNRGNINVTK